MGNELVSIIIPVYNTEKYLKRCLDSVVSQTYQNIEIILVDDGSTDSSGAICDDYSNKDSKITVYHNDNRGVSEARNAGIDVAKGKYILFVDSDDSISLDTVDILRDNTSEFDIVMAGHNIYSSNYKAVYSWKPTNSSKETYSRDEALMRMFDYRSITNEKYTHGYIGYSVNKLFKKSIIDEYNIRFNNNISYNEDRLFVVSYLLNCRNLCIINSSTYYYYLNSDCATEKSKNIDISQFDKYYSEIKAFDLMLKMLRYDDKLYYLCMFESLKRSFKLYLKINKECLMQKKRVAKEVISRSNILIREDKLRYKYRLLVRSINLFTTVDLKRLI